LNPPLLFGPPPLFEGEDNAAYNEILERVSGTIKPRNILEEIWTRDFTDITGENSQLRRARMTLVANSMADALEEALLPNFCERHRFSYPSEASRLVEKWVAGDQAAISEVEEILGAAKQTMDMISYRAFVNVIETIERIDRLITINERRRNAILREIERHRASLPKHILEVEDANYQTIAPNASASENSAKTSAA
jgi:hypothetical protein